MGVVRRRVYLKGKRGTIMENKDFQTNQMEKRNETSLRGFRIFAGSVFGFFKFAGSRGRLYNRAH